MAQFTGSVVKYPARASVIWYVGLILVGTILLSQPFCHSSTDRKLSWHDAVFTSTSASCVTGLVVRSTEFDLSFWGQLVVLVQIQLGGIGIMTVTTFVMFTLGSRQNLRSRALLSGTLGADDKTDLRWILRHVLFTTAFFEGIAFVLLAIRFTFDHTFLEALWHALFHSISAFCNAGFSLNDTSLVKYQGDLLVNLVIDVLVIVGGVGFPVILDVRRNWENSWSDRWSRLLLHTKIMLVGTAALLFLGMASFLLLEWDGILTSVPTWKRPMVAMFHSVSCRTAGFNSVDLSQLTNATLFISILLMIIGGGPCSTAGGFKVSTVMVLVLQAWTTFSGHTSINVSRRTIPQLVVQRATTTAILFTALAVIALTTLLVVEQSGSSHLESEGGFLEASFEVVSALGTVGLSTGLTPKLSVAARWIIILLMFFGRLGPISVFVALSRSQQKDAIHFPSEEPMIG